MLLKVAGTKEKRGASGGSGFGVNGKDLLEEHPRRVGQSGDCSQVEHILEDGDAMVRGRGEEVRRKDNVERA